MDEKAKLFVKINEGALAANLVLKHLFHALMKSGALSREDVEAVLAAAAEDASAGEAPVPFTAKIIEGLRQSVLGD